MIDVRDLSKRYGHKTVVDHVSFTVHPGSVTGFLGPNGAGKSTTMRMILGLARPASGDVLVNGEPLATNRRPMRSIGALLDASHVLGTVSGRNNLIALARTNGIPTSRVDECLALVGLTPVAGKAATTYSLGMRQRLGIAGAMLGDPRVLMFDEPVNGLDPEGVHWLRHLLRSLANEGRTVFISSHLLSEVAQTADHLVVIGKGRILSEGPTDEVTRSATSGHVQVRVDDPATFAQIARQRGWDPVPGEAPGSVVLTGPTTDEVGRLAHRSGVALLELSEQKANLEDAFLSLTADAQEYTTDGGRQ